MASPTPSLESRANSIGSPVSVSPVTVSGSSPHASDSAIFDVDSDSYIDAPKPGEDPYPSCRLGSSHTPCTGCKSTAEAGAVARCYDCNNFLCSNCLMAHQYMHCFEGHRVLNFSDSKLETVGSSNGSTGSSSSCGSCGDGGGSGNSSSSSGSGVGGGGSGAGGGGGGGVVSVGVGGSGGSVGGGGSGSGTITATTELPKNICNGSNTGGGNSLVINGNVTSNGGNGEKVHICTRHKQEILIYFCRSCSTPICKECTLTDHVAPLHDCAHISEVGTQQLEALARTVQECRAKAADARAVVKAADHNSAVLQVQYHKAQNEINETFNFYRSMLDERKQELLKELESVFSTKQLSLSVIGQRANEMADKMIQTCDFVERVTKITSITDFLMVKKLLESKLQTLLNYTPNTDITNQTTDLEFVSNFQAIQVGVRNTFGYVRSNNSENSTVSIVKQPPIARPTALSSNGISSSSNSIVSNGPGSGASTLGGLLLERTYSNGLISTNMNCGSSSSPSSIDTISTVISKRFSSANSLGPFSTTLSDVNVNGVANPYEKWSNGSDSYPVVTTNDHFAIPPTVAVAANAAAGDSVLELTSKLMSATAIFPPKSQIKRQKMIYHCKFGEFGVMEGQFTEPSGVAVNAQNDIIVADTNNHRIQIFDKEGRFKFQFGECGKRDGQLLYPNRVAVVKTSGDIIVTERSPTHQIQIYNQYGQFVRKFGANILQHPRGVTVDSKGRIVVVECKVMRVIIFDQTGNVLQKFGCSKHLEFPNGVVVNDKQEIFISDNRAHCVKVFNYEGAYLRQIGGEGITNYPIGVGINTHGEILIADNHNNFNLTIFTQDGQLVSALESKVKHAQCFDVALMDDGSVVLASKDYRLYIYRYVQVPPIGM